MNTLTKKRGLAAVAALSTVTIGTALSGPAAAASAPAYGTPAPFHIYTAGKVTLPTVANPTAQFMNTGVVKKTVNGGGAIQSWTTIQYTNGTSQNIIVGKPGANGRNVITNFISSKNGTKMKLEVRTSNNPSERSSVLAVQYTAKTKAAANVRTGQSTSSRIVKTLPTNTSVSFEQEFVTGNGADSSYNNVAGWGSVWMQDVSGNTYMADSTLNINPLS